MRTCPSEKIKDWQLGSVSSASCRFLCHLGAFRSGLVWPKPRHTIWRGPVQCPVSFQRRIKFLPTVSAVSPPPLSFPLPSPFPPPPRGPAQLLRFPPPWDDSILEILSDFCFSEFEGGRVLSQDGANF